MPRLTGEFTPNVRAPYFYLVHAVIECPRCMQPGSVFALAVPQGHERSADHDSSAFCAAAEDAWWTADSAAMLFHVEQIAAGAQSCLASLAPTFRPTYCKASDGSYWSSRCEHCGYVMEDYHLHCEPGGAFLPASEGSAGRVDFFEMPVAFSASAFGYADDPTLMHVLGMPDHR